MFNVTHRNDFVTQKVSRHGYKNSVDDCAKSSFTLYCILHTSHNDFCLSQIKVLCHI